MPKRKIEITDNAEEAPLTPEELKEIVKINIEQLYLKMKKARTLGEQIILSNKIGKIQRELEEALNDLNN